MNTPSLDPPPTTAPTLDTSPDVSRQERIRRQAWADNWFAGTHRCPRCGTDAVLPLGIRSPGHLRIEEWQCRRRQCNARWQVELRPSVLLVIDSLHPQVLDRYQPSILDT